MNRVRALFVTVVLIAIVAGVVLLSVQSASAANKAVPPTAAKPLAKQPATPPATPPAAPPAAKPPVVPVATDNATPQETLFAINLAAYRGIMFLGLLGAQPYAGREDIGDPPALQIAPKDERVGLTTLALFTQIQGNLVEFSKKATPAQKKILDGDKTRGIIPLVGELLPLLSKDPTVAQFRVRRLFLLGSPASDSWTAVIAKIGELDQVGTGSSLARRSEEQQRAEPAAPRAEPSLSSARWAMHVRGSLHDQFRESARR